MTFADCIYLVQVLALDKELYAAHVYGRCVQAGGAVAISNVVVSFNSLAHVKAHHGGSAVRDHMFKSWWRMSRCQWREDAPR